MAEECSVYDSRGLEQHLQSLFSRYSSDQLQAESKQFCSDFCKLVEEHASHWKLPLPQLRILEVALRYFTQASTFFTSNCDHVLHTLSSLALSVFELLLFFDQTDFHQEPLKRFTVTFQECHLVLAKHQNVHLHQVARWVQGGGPWASQTFQAILSESSLPQKEVEECIGCELPVFLELRVRYLLSCQRLTEALALAKCCAQHPAAGQHLFFLQVYLTWLCKTSQHERLHKEVSDFNGEDAVHIICSLESEEKDELLLALNRAFLSQQLRRGDMYYLCDLVFIWSKLHSRLKTSQQTLLKECHQLMLSATNVNSIFPFIRIILQELGNSGIQFCVELCANALKSCLSCDVVTKSLIYKTIASLLPNDLEVCRACALLVFFSERTVDAYKMVYLLYMHPDQEFHVECSPIGNHIRFETLQILKKDLYFDPEFWNLIALRTNCLKLMSEKVVGAALEEIMDEKWIPDYCKVPPLQSCRSVCQKRNKGLQQAKKRHHKDDQLHQDNKADLTSKRLKVGPVRTRINVDPSVKRKGSQGSRHVKEAPSEPLRRSYWQLDRVHDNVAGYSEQRRTTRLSEKNPPKRRIRKPRWLLEDSGTLENNAPVKVKRYSLKHQASVIKRSETAQVKNNTKHKVPLNAHLKTRENGNNKPQRYTSADGLTSNTPQVILELSLPDNELMGTFTEETCNRQRGYPQMLFYRPTVKIPASSQPVKPVHGKEVILRARDAAMFAQLLHCYARRQKGKGTSTNNQGSVSTITRSSVQGSPPKSEKPSVEMKATISSQSDVTDNVPQAQIEGEVSHSTISVTDPCQTSASDEMQTAAESEATEAPILDKIPEAQSKEKVLQAKASVSVLSKGSVEMKVTVASQTPAATKTTQPPVLERVSEPLIADPDLKVPSLSRDTSNSDDIHTVCSDETPPVSSVSETDTAGNTQSLDNAVIGGKLLVNGEHMHDVNSPSHSEKSRHILIQSVKHSPEKGTNPEENRVSLCEVSAVKESDNIDMSALTLVTEMVTEITRDLESNKDAVPEDSTSKQSVVCSSKQNVLPKLQSTSSCCQQQEESEDNEDNGSEFGDHVETEESKLLYTCTFCHKVFKGSRVVAHAMFHYRKDECMFCGVMFKDDLLAMMHLSDHIEKLKKLKETARNKDQESYISNTKDVSTPKASVKAKTTSVSPVHRNSERLKKSTEIPKAKTISKTSSPISRKLRSNDRLVQTPLLQKRKRNKTKHLKMKDPVHKLNGHIGKKKDGTSTKQKTVAPKDKLCTQHRQDISDGRMSGKDETVNHDLCTSTSIEGKKELVSSTKDEAKETESQQLKTTTKQNKQLTEKKRVELQEKLCCPVDGCAWFTDKLKNRVGLLYHALEDHYGDNKPLELAFSVGKGKCSICTRVLWSFEHFQHHVVRHRLTPRHPCLHQGCTARFKSGMEMRRHARRHSPLQAVCCLPGCSQLFICLWALNLHEKDHYASKSAKSVTNMQASVKHKNPVVEKKSECHKPKSAVADLAVQKNRSLKAKRKLRGQTLLSSSAGKHVKVPLFTDRTSVLKEQNEMKDSTVLKKLSNCKASSTSPASDLRLRKMLRKRQETRKLNLRSTRNFKILSSASKPNAFVEPILKKQKGEVNTQRPAKRRRLLQLAKTTDENTQKKEIIKKGTVVKEGHKNPAINFPKVTQASIINKVKEETKSALVQDGTTTSTTHEIEAKKPELKRVKTSLVRNKTQICATTGTCGRQAVRASLPDKTHKLKVVKGSKMRIGKKNAASKHKKGGPTEVKQRKTTNGKVTTKAVRKKCPQKKGNDQAALKKLEKPKTAVGTVKDPPATVTDISADVHNEDAHSAHPSGVIQVEDPRTVVPSAVDDEGNAKSDTTGTPENGPDVCAPVVTTKKASGKKEQKEAKAKKVPKKPTREKDLSTAPLPSAKAEKKKHRVNKTKDKNTDVKQQKKTGKTSASKAGRKMAAKVSQSSSDAGENAKEETLGAFGSSTSITANGSNQVTCQPSTSEEKQPSAIAEEQESNVTKNSGKANDESEVHQKHTDTKTVEGKCPSVDKDIPTSSKTKVQQVTKLNPVESEEDGQRPPAGPTGPGYSIMVNGQLTSEHKSAALKNAFDQFRKRPYMRLPPTAYLDEKYITMPKRRKEMSMFLESHKSPPLEQAKPAAFPQRQRCVNCFATFNTTEELHSHLQLQKCTNLFGFDSDDEGERSVST